MKRLICLILCCILLSGCNISETGEQKQTKWTDRVGQSWDREGKLLEIPLDVPNSLQYTTVQEFDGDLLLWSIDNHLENQYVLEMCLVELDSGQVSAENTLTLSQMVMPQIAADRMYLCDNVSGNIYELDKTLHPVRTWQVTPDENSWYMGGENYLYVYDWQGKAYVRNLDTMGKHPLLEGDPYVSYLTVNDGNVIVDYYRTDTGREATAIIDLRTAQVLDAEQDFPMMSTEFCDGTWLSSRYEEGYTYYLRSGEEAYRMADTGEDMLELLDRNTLLCTRGDGCTISLHDTQGKALAHCKVTENPFSYTCMELIPNEALNGYFIVASDYGSSVRLLFWNLNGDDAGMNIDFVPVPTATESEQIIRNRVAELETKYGITILTGEDCDTYFDSFRCETVTDFQEVSNALDTLDRAMSVYPEGFFRQIRYDGIHGVRIQLVGNLVPHDTQEYTDSYSAFAQSMYDHHLVVVDVYNSSEQTYYHEFAHVIDGFLEWDASQRENALFSEEAWNDLNPSWFTGYSYYYGQEAQLQDWTSFVDSYSTVKPTEDRARVMEYAMLEYGRYTFEDSDTLLNKLEYYCRCIRDAFDTSDWPETLLWEQFL